MSYYRGDYYRGDYYRGDLGGFIRKAAGVVGKVTSAISNPVATIAGFLAKKPTNAAVISNSAGMMGIGGAIGTAVRIGAKVIPPLLAGKEVIDLFGGGGLFGRNGAGGKRRTMNHLNPKALSRATRRVEGFVKKARKAVSPLGYTVVRRGSGGRCAPKKRCR